MKHSESIANLAAALVAAQADLRAVGKDSVNPHFKNRYASLDNIVEATRPTLAKHGLAVIQGATAFHSEAIALALEVETLLVHKSGEWLSNTAIVPVSKIDPQGAGGALTYGRRYGVSALLSLATDDDDDATVASAPRQNAAPARAPSNGSSVKVMPFGKTKGKPLGEHTTDELQKTVKWCREKDAEGFKDLVASINLILNDRALAPAGPPEDESELPF